MDRTELIDILKSSELLAGLPDPAIDTLVRKGRVQTLAKKQVVIEEGQPAATLCIVLRGVLEVVLPKKKEDGTKRVAKVELGVLGRGSYAGEYSLIDAQPASASVVACVESEVFVISQEHFRELLESEQAATVIYSNMLKRLVKKARSFDREVDTLSLL